MKYHPQLLKTVTKIKYKVLKGAYKNEECLLSHKTPKGVHVLLKGQRSFNIFQESDLEEI